MRDGKGPFFNRGNINMTRSTGSAPMAIAVPSASSHGALVRFVTKSAELGLRVLQATQTIPDPGTKA